MTVRLSGSVRIDRPIETVFAYFDDPIEGLRGGPCSNFDIQEITPLPNGGKRTRGTCRGTNGKAIPFVMEHVEYVRNERVVIRAAIGDDVPTIATRRFEPIDGGTRLVAEVEYSISRPIMGRIIETMWRRHSQLGLERLLANLKSKIETRPVS